MAKRNYGAAANRQKPPERETGAAAPRIRTEPIRVTLDLSPRQHQALKTWCNLTAGTTGLPAVPLAQVLRLLGERLVSGDSENPELHDQLQASIRRGLLLQQAAEQAGRNRLR